MDKEIPLLLNITPLHKNQTSAVKLNPSKKANTTKHNNPKPSPNKNKTWIPLSSTSNTSAVPANYLATKNKSTPLPPSYRSPLSSPKQTQTQYFPHPFNLPPNPKIHKLPYTNNSQTPSFYNNSPPNTKTQ